MSFDVLNASLVAGGEGVSLKPIELEGIQVGPPVSTLCSQITGAGATVLRARHSGGRARIFGVVKDFQTTETELISEANYLTLGQAVWFTQVVVQHRQSAAVSVLWVPGTIALLAAVAKPTLAEIKTFLGLNDASATLGITGDIRFHRSADTVISVATTSERRPAYVDDGDKTGILANVADNTTLVAVPGGHVDFPIDLTSAYAIAAGSPYIDGAALPAFPYGGRIEQVEYIGTVNGAGAGASMILKANVDGTAVTGADLTLLLATTATPARVISAKSTSTNTFLPGEGLDIEVDTKTAAFTGGSGVIRVHLAEFVPE